LPEPSLAAHADPGADALEAYEAAVERARIVRQAWDDAGRPVLTTGSRKQNVPHPLLKAIRDAELLADRLRLSVRTPRMGRPPLAVVDARITDIRAGRIRRKEGKAS
jgi:hypothetical protein